MKTFRKIFVFLVFIFISPLVNSEINTNKDPEFLHPDKAFVPTINYVDNSYIEVNWDIQPGYYLYMGMFKFSSDNPEAKILKVTMPDGIKKKDEFFGDVDVYYATTTAKIFLNDNFKNFNLIISYQGCADAGLCYPPITKTFEINQKSDSGFYYKKVNLPEDQISISNLLYNKTILVNIFLFFIAGILLSFTPCVFPMIPILTGLIIGQGENISTKKSFLLSLTYVVSMSLTYALAGILIALSGSNIQANLQNPYVISSFALLFFILAMSMFNILTIQMPKFIQNLLVTSTNKTNSGSFYGVGLMGSLSALIVGPCVTAPLIGALIYIASSKDYVIGGFALFSMGLGMGMPLLILGTSASKIIKKVGPYLDITNKFFGLLFCIVAIWLLERIISIQAAAYLWAALSILVLYFLTKITFKETNLFKYLTKGFSTILLVYFFLQIYGANYNSNFSPVMSFINKDVSVKFSKVENTADLTSLVKGSNKITMIDLYADWCVACKELDKYTFNNIEVVSLLNRINLVKFDITKTNKDNSDFLKKYKLFGPPTLLFFTPDGNEIPDSRIIGYVDAKLFIKKFNHINKLLSSKL